MIMIMITTTVRTTTIILIIIIMVMFFFIIIISFILVYNINLKDKYHIIPISSFLNKFSKPFLTLSFLVSISSIYYIT